MFSTKLEFLYIISWKMSHFIRQEYATWHFFLAAVYEMKKKCSKCLHVHKQRHYYQEENHNGYKCTSFDTGQQNFWLSWYDFVRFSQKLRISGKKIIIISQWHGRKTDLIRNIRDWIVWFNGVTPQQWTVFELILYWYLLMLFINLYKLQLIKRWF